MRKEVTTEFLELSLYDLRLALKTDNTFMQHAALLAVLNGYENLPDQKPKPTRKPSC